jgi:phosphoribosylformylglycinamidine synthase subunit PurSL
LQKTKRIEVSLKPDQPDARGSALVRDIQDLAISGVREVRVVDVYLIEGEIAPDALETVGRRLLADPVTQRYHLGTQEPTAGAHQVEVAFNPGVADPVGSTIIKALEDLGISGISEVRTATRYIISGDLTDSQLDEICAKLLVNPIIQHVSRNAEGTARQTPQYEFQLNHYPIRQPDGLAQVKARFGFFPEELEAIVAHFREIGRDPTDAEIETLAQTWSEHCVHKTFKSRVTLGRREINDLLKSTVMRATRELDKPWCLSVFEDNAGVIDFDQGQALCFKVETHNHPSAVEPYGGAATGIGGVIRDVLGTGLAALPILNTDVFCFAEPDMPYADLPPGVLHPRRLFKGVRAGVADYGNRMGIPTLNGAVCFDPRYVANPLVYCGTLGIMPSDKACMGRQQPGDLVVVLGGRTGRDGIHGVTFASEQLTGESSQDSVTSVQIGNPIIEKKVLDVLMQARDLGYYRRITDCGGGGLSSAIGEMGEDTGVRVDLDRIPLKFQGLTYAEIWISESQERMLLAVPPEHGDALVKLCADENVEATVIGEFTDNRRLELFYEGTQVCDLTMEFLHGGYPQITSQATLAPPPADEPGADIFPDPDTALLKVLGSWNVCSKEWVIRQYDHEVQGLNVLKPLVGVNSDGPGDAAVLKPLADSEKGVVVSCGINTRYGDIDPYWMAASVIEEALRQIIAVGGSLERVALLDNFCWGDTSKPDNLGALVRACGACYDMAIAYGTPFISGKDSLNNEYEHDGERLSIPHTLLISVLGVMDDVNRTVSMDLKQAGSQLYLVGTTVAELGGSEYYHAYGELGTRVPRVDTGASKRGLDAISRATARGLVRACHDLSDGGLAVALAEMAFAGNLGASVDLTRVPLGETITRDDLILFSESNSRFLVEVAPEQAAEFEAIMSEAQLAQIGVVTDSPAVEIRGLSGEIIINRSCAELKEAWQRPMRW